MDNPCEAATGQPPSPRQVMLGLLILGQLAFLLLSNLLGFYQDPQESLPKDVGAVINRVLPGYANASGHTWKVPDEFATALQRWSQLTGQDQRWALFAPGVYQRTGFPGVVFVADNDPASTPALARTFDLLNRRGVPHEDRMDGLQIVQAAALEPPAMRAASQLITPLAATSPVDAAVLLNTALDPAVTAAPLNVDVFLSDNEPADREHFARLGNFRLRRFESSLAPLLTRREDETLGDARVRWAAALQDHVNANADAIHRYLQWRLAAYRERYSARPVPKQVILVERVFNILPPGDESGEHWDGPRTLPIARWQPEAELPKDCRPIERYHPVTARFENVRK